MYHPTNTWVKTLIRLVRCVAPPFQSLPSEATPAEIDTHIRAGCAPLSMARPLWLVRMLTQAFPYRAWLARLTRFPLVRWIADRFVFWQDYVVYLPQDRVVKKTIQVRQRLDEPESTVLPSDIVHRLIDQASFLWLMNFCICRSASNCRDYPVDYGCLFLGEAARGINPELGRPVTREEAHEHIRRCQEAGLVHMVGRNKLDTLWLGVGPGDRLLTVCNCCPCCCLWTMLPKMDRRLAQKVNRMPGVTLRVNDRCTGCGRCLDVCFVDAVEIRDGTAHITGLCRGCGRCVDICPQGAVEMKIPSARRYDETAGRLSSLVDVR